ncbi:response regulator [Candidatus Protochlamydia phocaeensis]|uniref:response regulator n=1 Tax=Candidatus Protochlamydia phocaeensis TaxID=1414722 RepID=UPI0008380CDE|nr:response regulator [Candidatus Protochlamydia phocaeensis]
MTLSHSDTISILLAEDDDDQFFIIKTVFEKLLLVNELHRVNDGEELMDYLLRRGEYALPNKAPRPELILLDLNMPKKNGLEALKEIRNHPDLCHTPVVVLTALTDQDTIRMCYAAGANSYIAKPVGPEGLVRALKDLRTYWFQLVKLPPGNKE